jgi:hypothetical protein
MAITAPCPNCKRDVAVAFDLSSGSKFLPCPCGETVQYIEPNFAVQPEFLFKYRPHDNYSQSWILKEELFFASPAMFNDPFDSKVFYSLEGTLEQKAESLVQWDQELNRGIGRERLYHAIREAEKDGFWDRFYNGHIGRIQELIDASHGIVSLSGKPDDLLMFAYYAKDHTGYCLKYRRSAENILSMAQPIKYEEKYPVFSAFGPDSTNLGRLGDKVLFTKAKCWKHEDEWRIGLTGFDARLVKSPHPILEGIIFGCNMKSKERSEIVDLNNRRTKPVALFETRKMKFEFALEIVPLKL